LHKYCVAARVDSTNDLKLAPQNIKNLLIDDKKRPNVLKYIKWREDQNKKSIFPQPRIYADGEERFATIECNDRCIEILQDFIGLFPNRSNFRALDCAGGNGRFSVNFLLNIYKKVDLFDQSPIAIREAKENTRGHAALGYISHDTMQTFTWTYQYDMIFMVWCFGYLKSPELVDFLRKAQKNLSGPFCRPTRQTGPGKYIIVFDNVRNEEEEIYEEKGQTIRTGKELEDIFDEAGLVVYKRSEREAMPKEYRDV
jgi:SAM-dependent methyltransferase